eukprot:symbB.v1.2.003472.t1/scaffold149.1/size460148/11
MRCQRLRWPALAGLAVLPVSRSFSECQRRQHQPAYTRRDPRTGFEMRLGDPEGMNHGPLRIFTGNAHPTLANAITRKIGVPVKSLMCLASQSFDDVKGR